MISSVNDPPPCTNIWDDVTFGDTKLIIDELFYLLCVGDCHNRLERHLFVKGSRDRILNLEDAAYNMEDRVVVDVGDSTFVAQLVLLLDPVDSLTHNQRVRYTMGAVSIWPLVLDVLPRIEEPCAGGSLGTNAAGLQLDFAIVVVVGLWEVTSILIRPGM